MLLGSWNATVPYGGISVLDTPTFSGGSPSGNFAIGNTTGVTGLPVAITSYETWSAFADALLLKTSELASAGLTVTLSDVADVAALGGTGNDTFTVFSTSLGHVRSVGGAGNDSLGGGSTTDTLDGGTGNDSLFGAAGADCLIGGEGADTIIGGAGADTISGGAGADVFGASALSELNGDRITDFTTTDRFFLGQTLGGGLIDARLTASGGDTLLEIDGDHNGSFETVLTLTGNFTGTISLGSDGVNADSVLSILVLPPAAPAGLDLATAGDSGISNTDNVTIVTSPFITGSAATGSTVTLYDTDGTTVLGTDVAVSGAFAIRPTLSQGAHVLTAKATIGGSAASAASTSLTVTVDTATATPSAPDLAAGSDDGGSSTDNITSITTPTFTGTAETGATVTLYDTDGTTVLGTAVAASGAWSIASSALGLGAHTVTALATDTAGNVSTVSAGLAVTVVTPVVPDPGPPPTPTTGTVSSGGNETIGGAAGDDSLAGSTGNDSVAGGAGADLIDGGGGNDSVSGGEGTDNIRGLADNDSIDGGAGIDTVNGNQGSDTVFGGGGADMVFGGQGSDLVDGGEGDDSHVNGNLGADTVSGGEGNDLVYGGQGDDSVYGGAGDDRVSGDLGNDNLFGGSGADRFAFGQGYGQDWVADFSFAEGDRILLAPGQAYTVVVFGGQVMLDLGGGDVIGLAGVATFDAAYVSFG